MEMSDVSTATEVLVSHANARLTPRGRLLIVDEIFRSTARIEMSRGLG